MNSKKPIIIANWKMKLGTNEAVNLAKEIKKGTNQENEIVICPSFVSISEVGEILKGSQIKLGAQDCFWESEGAYTGEVSAKQLRELGCEFVILGHSERRQYLKETDEVIHSKIRLALNFDLVPILCVGETFEQRQEGAKDYVLIQQVTKALEGIEIDSAKQLIIAYEPVWVIGSGQAIDPAEAAAAHQVIFQCLFDLFPSQLVKSNLRIIYGVSVDESNISNFVSLENTDGVLVGGASLKAKNFLAIIKNI